MKIFKRLTAVCLLASLALFQKPVVSSCAAAFRAPTVQCHMPCCKKSPMPANCPHLKAAVPNDAIVASFKWAPAALQALYAVTTVTLSLPSEHSANRHDLFAQLHQRHLEGPPPGRSPPVLL